MANYHFEAKVIQRSKGMSITDRVAYITAQKLVDAYTGRTYDRRSHNGSVPHFEIALPPDAPSEYRDVQCLLDALNASEKRKDAQMGRSYILSLPLELSGDQQLDLAREFVKENFTRIGQCTIWALHRNEPNRQERGDNLLPVKEIRENPHLHLIVPFRAVDQGGFQPTKVASQATNNPQYLVSLRKDWADRQNAAFSRLGMNVRVSHESLAMQGIKRQATIPIGAASLALERKGIRTQRGGQYRSIQRLNERLRLPEHDRAHRYGPSH